MTEEVTYRGNCHCAKFRFEVVLPKITSAVSCNCVACFKTGILWAFPADGDFKVTRNDGSVTTTQHGGELDHEFCSNCSSQLTGTHLSGPLEGKFGINIRTLLGVNPFDLEIEPSNHPAAKISTSDSAVDSEGDKIYKGSCICGAVSLSLKTKPLPEVEIKEDNCSICVRNAYLGVYPLKPQVEIPSSSEANASTYAWGQKFGGSRFCRACGVNLFSDLYGPPADVVATWPEGRQAMVARKLNIKPINVRALDGVEWDSIKVNRADEGTEGYVVD